MSSTSQVTKKVDWGRFVKHFFIGATTLGTLVGAFWAALTFDVLWVFWLIFPLCIVYGLAHAVLPWVKNQWLQLKEQLRLAKDHPRAMKAAGIAQEKVEELEEQLRNASASGSVFYSQGVLSGRKRVVGEIWAAESGAILSPVAMAIENGKLVIAATVEPVDLMPATGSVWLLRLRGLELVQAVLIITAQSKTAVSLCIEESLNLDFMDALTKQAATDGHPSPALEIVRRPFESIDELREEYSS